jgi:cell wall-associated NlpC family hydrolase
MRTVFSLAVALLISPLTLQAADPIKLELAIHRVARAARRVKADPILVLVREDVKSTKSLDTAETLKALEKQLQRMLGRESGVSGLVDDKASEAATKSRARRNLRPGEAAAILKDVEAKAVLTADFREARGRLSVRLALVDSVRTLFTETVSLNSRPQAEAEKPEESKDKRKNKPTKTTGIDGETGPPKPSNGPSGYVVRRSKENPGIARTRGGPGSVGIPVKGFGQGDPRREKKTDGKKKDGRDSEQVDGNPGEAAPRNGESTQGRKEGERDTPEKSANTARRVPPPNSQIAKDIVRFATSQIGKQVGNGQCWTLAAEALRAAGAEPPKGYTFGTEIPLQQIQPGDILQFTTARFDEPGYWAIMGTPNHTAVVYSLGDRTFILHQNVGGKKYVQTFDLDFDNLTSGRVQAFRAVPRTR